MKAVRCDFATRSGVGVHNRSPSFTTRPSLHTLDDHRDALANSDTHRAQRVAATSRGKLIHCRGHEPRACHAEWVANRDGATIWIDVLGIVRKSQLAQHSEALRCERFVELDNIYLSDIQAYATQRFAARGHGTDSHDSRLDTSSR